MNGVIFFDMRNYTSDGIRVWCSAERAELIRFDMRLKRADRKGIRVTISWPEDTMTVCSTFMSCLLAKSVEALGAEEFRRRYTTRGPAHVVREVEEMIERCARTHSPLPATR